MAKQFNFALGCACSIGLAGPSVVVAQTPVAVQIEEAVAPLAQEDRDGATVLGYRSGSALVTLRQGTNHFTCLADTPGDERFQVSCYHTALEPFMARGRELRDQGVGAADVRRMRGEEIAAGTLAFPQRATVLNHFGTLQEGQSRPDSVSVLHVIYLPNATAAETGLSERPGNGPWLMDGGQHRAHVMISLPRVAFRSAQGS